MKEEMTVYKALCELKVLDARIRKGMNEYQYVMAYRHASPKINGSPVTELSDAIKSQYQSVVDLISRRNAIKAAVVASNATTKLNIDGKEYLVAVAIDMYNTGIEYFADLRNRLATDLEAAKRNVAAHSGDVMQKKAEDYVINMFKEKEKDVSDAAKKAMEVYIEVNSYDLLDPLAVEKKIKSLDDLVSKFNADFDSALSVSNATTKITIEY